MRHLMTFSALIALMGTPALAQEESWQDIPLEEREGKSCISIPRIKSSDVLDDHNIVFDMRGRDMYLNKLPNRCPNLAFEDTFTYSTPLSQLCNTDIITVLRNIGSGFMRGPSCGLDKFVPITKEEVKELKAEIKQAKKEKREKKKAEYDYVRKIAG